MRYFTLPELNFGLSAAVPQYNRFPEAVIAIARRLGAVMAVHFFDDVNVTEEASTAASGQRFVRELAAALGQPFQPEKAKDVSLVVLFLGVESDLSRICADGVVCMSIRPDRIERLVATIILMKLRRRGGSRRPERRR